MNYFRELPTPKSFPLMYYTNIREFWLSLKAQSKRLLLIYRYCLWQNYGVCYWSIFHRCWCWHKQCPCCIGDIYWPSRLFCISSYYNLGTRTDFLRAVVSWHLASMLHCGSGEEIRDYPLKMTAFIQVTYSCSCVCCQISDIKMLLEFSGSSFQPLSWSKGPWPSPCLPSCRPRRHPATWQFKIPNLVNAHVLLQTVTERIDVSMVHGIGFDATCSLVVLDKHFLPVSVSPTGK